MCTRCGLWLASARGSRQSTGSASSRANEQASMGNMIQTVQTVFVAGVLLLSVEDDPGDGAWHFGFKRRIRLETHMSMIQLYYSWSV